MEGQLPLGLTLEAPSGIIQGIPTQIEQQRVSIKVEAASLATYTGKPEAYMRSLQMTVKSANAPPVLAAIGNRSVSAGTLVTFSVGATDQDGNDAFTYSATALPVGAHFDPTTQTFRWTPSAEQVGAYSVTFMVSDGALTDSETIQLIVTAAPAG